MNGDTSKAVKFLKQFYPKGPWLLTSIDPDKKGICSETFTNDQLAGLTKWLNRWNGARNIYFSVNPPLRTMNKKAERTDIKSLCYLHVDVDPRAGEDLVEEQARAKALCTTNLPSGVPEPTFVVFSGGGYQAFWRLEDPIPIDGDLEKAEDAKLYNIQLERLFSADNCHNIDRIMRVPGTVNIPDAKKRNKGRTDTLARIEKVTTLSYKTSVFTKAQPVQLPASIGIDGTTSNSVKVEVSGNIARLDSVDVLDQWNVPNRVRVIIVQGSDPDTPKTGDNSRSGWLFDCVCNLVRCDVPDDVIFSIITDPDFLISESVLDKGSNTERYALRTIGRAKEEAIEPALRQLNEQFAVIENFGGRCVVIEEINDEAFGGRARLAKQPFTSFRERFMNKTVQCGVDAKDNPIYKQMGKWWLEHPARRQYHSVIFQPGHESTTQYNMWRGFKFESKPGDCSLFIEHIKNNICNNNEEHYTYLVGWLARAVQKPARAGEVAVVLRGGQGTGKGFFAKTFGRLFGRHFLQITNSNHLVGNFNNHLRDAVIVFADEAFYAGDKKHESVLKGLVTEETLVVEPKGVDIDITNNYTHIIMASNNNWVVPADGDDRRYFVLDVSNGEKQNGDYFSALQNQLDNGGYEALLHMLMTFDIKDYDVRKVPKTEALNDQKIMSFDPEEAWWYSKLLDGNIMSNQRTWIREIVKEDLYQDYIQESKDAGIGRRSGQTVLGMFLKKVLPGGFPITKRMMCKRTTISYDGYQIEQQVRLPHYIFATLDECRKAWDRHYGSRPWPEPEPDDDIPF